MATEPAGEARGPAVVAWETTRRCMLRCRHCRGSARDTDYAGELSTDEGRRLVDALAAAGGPLLILTGGEPMAREDIYDLARYGTDRGLRVVMAPCGPLITAETARKMLEAGVRRISVSLDGADAAGHDAFRGAPGAFEAALRGIGHARAAGLPFQVNTTVTRLNANELDAILALAVEQGAAALDLFLLVPTGRGAALRDLEIAPEDYERVLCWVADRTDDAPLPVKVTCAPHYARVIRQRRAGKPAAAAGHPGRPSPRGCMAGQGFVFVSHRGVLQPCGFLAVPCGDLREADFDFAGLYERSPVFRALRDPDGYGGACGRCEYRRVCGGCRARAYEATGDFLAAEPLCAYTPRGERVP
jgi:heme b synthase